MALRAKPWSDQVPVPRVSPGAGQEGVHIGDHARPWRSPKTQAILFDIDGTLIESGGSSDRAWHRAFEELHGVDVQISKVTGKGVPDPAVGRQAFEAVIGREPSDEEMAKLMAKRLQYLPEEVESSDGYRVMPGTEKLLDELIDRGVLLGLVTGNVEAAAHIKLARANLNRFFSFGGYGSDSPDRGELTKKALEREASSSARSWTALAASRSATPRATSTPATSRGSG